MSTITTPLLDVEVTRRYTPEELLALPDAVSYELNDDGQLVERAVGFESSWIGGRLYSLLNVHCQQNRLGWAVPADASYQCFPRKPKQVRKPDASFVRTGRFPNEKMPAGHCRIPPDLAVEVISPNDLASDVDGKVLEYLEVGVPIVWVVHPATRVVVIYRADGSVAIAGTGHELSGEQVIPGFRCRVDDLFPNPPPVTPVVTPAPAL